LKEETSGPPGRKRARSVSRKDNRHDGGGGVNPRPQREQEDSVTHTSALSNKNEERRHGRRRGDSRASQKVLPISISRHRHGVALLPGPQRVPEDTDATEERRHRRHRDNRHGRRCDDSREKVLRIIIQTCSLFPLCSNLSAK